MVFGALLWIEWQVRQLTAAELAWTLFVIDCWTPLEKESVPPLEKTLTLSWQERHSCAPAAPLGTEMRVLSPPASMCFAPSP